MGNNPEQGTFAKEYELLEENLQKRLEGSRKNIHNFLLNQDPKNLKTIGIDDGTRHEDGNIEKVIEKLYQLRSSVFTQAKNIARIANTRHITPEELLKDRTFKLYARQRKAVIDLSNDECIATIMTIMDNMNYLEKGITNTNSKKLVK